VAAQGLHHPHRPVGCGADGHRLVLEPLGAVAQQQAVAAPLDVQVALTSRVLIEQAKSVLMERHGLDEQVAFDQLRRLARSSGRRLTDVAHDVVGDRSR
jgi:hypothetical protein